MRQSDDIAALSEALSAAQESAKHATLDSVNPHFRSKYASLGSVIDAIKPSLADNGLALVMAPVVTAGAAGVDWMLTHKSGQWISGSTMLPLSAETPQAAGSAITYARRYTYSALLGIAADDDDDGNAGSAPATKAAPQAHRAPSASPKPAPAPPPHDPNAPFAGEPEPGGWDEVPAEQAPRAAGGGDQPATDAQKRMLWGSFKDAGQNPGDKEGRHRFAAHVLGAGYGGSFSALTKRQVSILIDALRGDAAMDRAEVARVFAGE